MDRTDFIRVPGLYRVWDLGSLIEQGRIWRIEDAGRTDDGQALFQVFVDEAGDEVGEGVR